MIGLVKVIMRMEWIKYLRKSLSTRRSVVIFGRKHHTELLNGNKIKKQQESSSRSIFCTEAEVNNESNASGVSVKQLLAELSADTHMMYNSLHDRTDKV